MSQLDASVISQIPGYAGNPVAAEQQGLTLANAAQGYQTSAIDLQQKKQDQKDQAAAKEILKDADLSTYEGQTKAAQAITKINPKMGMDFMAQAQRGQQQGQELTLEKLQVHAAQSDALAGAVDNVVAQLDQEAKKPGMTPAMLDAKAKQLAIPAALQLRQQQPELAPYIDKVLQDPNNLTYQGIKSLDEQSNRGNKAVHDRLLEAKQDQQEKEAAKRDAQNDKRLDLESRRVSDAETKEENRKKEAQEGIISQDSSQLAVERILNGEQARDVLANFGRGKQGPANIAKVQNLLAQTAKGRGLSSQDISARMVEMKGLVKEQQTEATIAGKISYAEKEIEQIAPKVIGLADKLDRGSFVPWNKLQNMAATQISSPELKQLKAYLNTLTNSYDVLGGRGGTDVEKRAHNRALLDAADSPQALRAAVEAIQQEAQLSAVAAQESMQVNLPGQSRPGANPAPAAAAGWGQAKVVGGQ